MGRLITVAGGSEPVNEGERRVVAALQAQLPDTYWIIPNSQVQEPNGSIFEYDVIVLAPHAVYAIETKDWWGTIKGDEYEWSVDGKTRQPPILLTARKARVLKSKLVAYAPVLARVWVEPAVVFASQPTLSLTPEGARRVFMLDQLVRFLTDPAQARRRPYEIADLGDTIRRALGFHLRPRSGPTIFGSYQVLEVLEQSEAEGLYRAKHRLMPGAPVVRLRVVSLSPYLLSEEQRTARRTALLRETEALLRMGSHPNIIAAREAFEDDGYIGLVFDGTEGRSLRQRLQDGTPMTVDERLDVLVGICRALAHAHANGVIHRHIEPLTILLADDGTPRLAHFELAKLLTTDAVTVWHEDTADDVDRRYLAPELINQGYGLPTPSTDLYELGCVAYELFAGKPPFSDPVQAFTGMPPLPQGVPDKLGDLLQSLLQGNPALRPVDTKDVLAAFEGMRGEQQPRPSTGPKDQYAPGDVIDGKFEVRGKLGGGGFSMVYRVYWAMDDREYAIKVFNASVPYDKVQREIGILRGISHPHIVHAVWADQTRAGQWYLVTELVQGETLEAYSSGRKRLSPAEAVEVTCQLLSALEAIHPNHLRMAELETKGDLTEEEYQELLGLKQQGIVHRDIKPQNMILTSHGVVLIDFNIASRAGQPVLTQSGTPPYQSPDLVPGVDSWNPSPDLFASGVVLYELLCCEHPYEQAQPRVDRQPRDPRDFRQDISPALAAFLMKACAPWRAERFATATEMRVALEAINPLVVTPPNPKALQVPRRLQDLIALAPPNINPMVGEFLALSSQARRSNRSTRGMDDLAEATYVETRLNVDLTASVLAGRHRLILITGNAGDGKTAFIQKVEAAAKRAGASEIQRTSNGCKLQYNGRDILTLYDGSQDEADRTSDEVLQDFLAPFANGPLTDETLRLAAINEGRLRDFLLTHRTSFPLFAENVIAILDDPATPQNSDDIVVVNLNLRSVTAGGAQSIFSRQLHAIVDGAFWTSCEQCEYRARCPLKYNVDTFRDSTSGAAATERLRTLVDLVRLRRRRHLTMRDVRSLLSHLLFRDRTCEEIPHLLASGEPFDIINLAYFQGPGGLGVPQDTALERGAALLNEIDVALVANPEYDRALALGHAQRRMSFPDRPSSYPTELMEELRKRAGDGYEANAELARRVHEAARRHAYFERADDGWWTMLPYQRLREFTEALDPANEDGRQALRKEVIRAISMHEGISNGSQAEQALWVATSEQNNGDFRSFRCYSLEDFDLQVAKTEAPYVEIEPDHLRLIHKPSGAYLEIDIDLLEVLERLKEGYMPSMDESRGFLVNLVLFKYQLLAQPATELMVATETGLVKIGLGSTAGSLVLSEVSDEA